MFVHTMQLVVQLVVLCKRAITSNKHTPTHICRQAGRHTTQSHSRTMTKCLMNGHTLKTIHNSIGKTGPQSHTEITQSCTWQDQRMSYKPIQRVKSYYLDPNNKGLKLQLES